MIATVFFLLLLHGSNAWFLSATQTQVHNGKVENITLTCQYDFDNKSSEIERVLEVAIYKHRNMLYAKALDMNTYYPRQAVFTYPGGDGYGVTAHGYAGQPSQSYLSVTWEVSSQETVGSYFCRVKGSIDENKIEYLYTRRVALELVPQSREDILNSFFYLEAWSEKFQRESNVYQNGSNALRNESYALQMESAVLQRQSDDLKKDSNWKQWESDKMQRFSDLLQMVSFELQSLSEHLQMVSVKLQRLWDRLQMRSVELERLSDRLQTMSVQLQRFSDRLKMVSVKLPRRSNVSQLHLFGLQQDSNALENESLSLQVFSDYLQRQSDSKLGKSDELQRQSDWKQNQSVELQRELEKSQGVSSELQRLSEMIHSMAISLLQDLDSPSLQMTQPTTQPTTRPTTQTPKTSPIQWPEGEVVLLKTNRGCPKSRDGRPWQDGYVRFNTESSSGEYIRNDDSVSEPSHIERQFKLWYQTVNHFFMYTCRPFEKRNMGAPAWPKGTYCVLQGRKHLKPDGFWGAWVKLDMENDGKPLTVSMKGSRITVDKKGDVKLFFYCRNDGNPSNPIKLPVQTPFHLFRYGNQCQKVLNAKVTNESFTLDTEDDNNRDRASKKLRKHVKLNPVQIQTCYYKPIV